jgi:predicted ATPase with chaperone activity
MAPSIKRRRHANGPRRPRYLSSTDADRAVMMILALASEISALRDRLDTHEQLAAAGKMADRAAVEAYESSEAVEAARAAARRTLIERVTRVLLETEMERNTEPDGDPTDVPTA